jgi:hypothetical protein
MNWESQALYLCILIDFCLQQNIPPVSGTPSAFYSIGTNVFFWVKGPGHKADHSLPTVLTLRICGFIPLHPYTPFWRERRNICLHFLYGAEIGQSIQSILQPRWRGMYLLFLQGKRIFTPLANCTNQLPIKRLPQALFSGLTLRLLMSYIYGAPNLDVSRSHTTTQHSR